MINDERNKEIKQNENLLNLNKSHMLSWNDQI